MNVFDVIEHLVQHTPVYNDADREEALKVVRGANPDIETPVDPDCKVCSDTNKVTVNAGGQEFQVDCPNGPHEVKDETANGS